MLQSTGKTSPRDNDEKEEREISHGLSHVTQAPVQRDCCYCDATGYDITGRNDCLISSHIVYKPLQYLCIRVRVFSAYCINIVWCMLCSSIRFSGILILLFHLLFALSFKLFFENVRLKWSIHEKNIVFHRNSNDTPCSEDQPPSPRWLFTPVDSVKWPYNY